MHRFGIVMIALMLWPAVTMAAQTPVAPIEPACRDLMPYRQDMISTWNTRPSDAQVPLSALTSLDAAHLATVPPDDLNAIADWLDTYRTNLDAIAPIPEPIAPLHELYMDRVVLVSHLVRSHANSDLLAAIGYVELLAANRDAATDAIIDVQYTCDGRTWWPFAAPRPPVYPLFWPGWEVTTP